MDPFTIQDYLDAHDSLQRASSYLAEQFNHDLAQDEAMAHFQARALLLVLRHKIMLEVDTDLKGRPA